MNKIIGWLTSQKFLLIRYRTGMKNCYSDFKDKVMNVDYFLPLFLLSIAYLFAALYA